MISILSSCDGDQVTFLLGAWLAKAFDCKSFLFYCDASGLATSGLDVTDELKRKNTSCLVDNLVILNIILNI